MGNFASRVHSKEDGKVYNILPMGDMPTVVFGRVIRPNSVPGMQYYFIDGMIKWKDENEGVGYRYVKPFPIDDYERHWGRPCIFTIPENFDFSKMGDIEYVKQFTRRAMNLNANTTSQNFIIREGNIICIRKLTLNSPVVVSRLRRYKKSNKATYKETFWSYTDDSDGYLRNKKRIIKLASLLRVLQYGNFLKELILRARDRYLGLRNTITFIPIVSRCPRRKSIFHYKYRCLKKSLGSGGREQWYKYYRIN